MAELLFNPRSFQPSQRLIDFVSHEKRLDSHLLFQSSGSTGNPKWVALSREALEVSARACNEHLDVSSKDIFGLSLPRFHVGGYGILERARVSGAACTEYGKKWNAAAFYEWLCQEKVSICSFVAAQVFDLHEFKAPESLRAVVVGGGRMPEDLFLRARKNGWPLLPSYGLTECASQVATAQIASLSELKYPEAKILSHIEAKQIAEQKVAIKSSALFSWYLLEKENDIQLFDSKENAFFVLPDKVEFSSSGGIKVLGRWEEDHKVLGEWIRWDWMQKKFYELAFAVGKYQQVEISLYSDARQGNIIVFLCEDFDNSAKSLVNEFNCDLFPFERITHYFEGSLARSELGKILPKKLKKENFKAFA